MSKRSEVKYKFSRTIGESLWGRAKDPVNRRATAPGQHGATRNRKLSDYGTQLMAKQKLKKYYGNITEKQFRKTYHEAIRMKGDSSENLIGLLERRLDAVVYRMCVVPTVFAARQFVNHGHVKVNGKKVNIPSYQVKVNDVIEIKESVRQTPVILECLQAPERDIPDYLSVDLQNFKCTFVRVPQVNEVPYPIRMEPNLVIEYYSR
jgi:small subunit ribosomal protein S4